MTREPSSTRRRSFSSLLLGLSNVSETLLPLVRGMALARLLQPDQFGLAISITIVASVAELVSELGVNQMALRMGLGQNLGTLHSIAAIRGVLLGCVIAVSGPAVVLLFHTSQAMGIYSVVGLASVIRGFSHLEPKARMREYRYAPEAASILSGQVIWTLTSITVALVMPDYRAMVFGLLASTLGSLVVSHLMATQPYRFRWDRRIVSESFAYGRPLILNGLALSVAGLGDRFLIGWKVGLEPLAQYTTLASAAFLPRSAVTKFMVSLFTPQFVNAGDPEERRRLGNIWLLCLTTLGGGFGLGFIACGQEFVRLAFGSKYVIAQDLINLVGFLACIRYMATAPLAPAMALGYTKLVLLNTASAASGLVIGACLLPLFPSLDTLVASMIAGEGVALLWVLSQLRSLIAFTPVVLWTAVGLPNSLIAGVTTTLLLRPDLTIGNRIELCGAALAIMLLCAGWLLRISGSGIADILRRLLPRHPGIASQS